MARANSKPHIFTHTTEPKHSQQNQFRPLLPLREKGWG